MPEPTPEIKSAGPIEVLEARTLFPSDKPVRNSAASLVRLDAGPMLLAYMHKPDALDQNNAVLMLRRSEDDGETWSEPEVLYEYPSWSCMAMGGISLFSDDFIRTIIGRIQVDRSLGGDEPMTGWWVSSIDSRDGGRTWTEPAPEIRLFPYWTEMYGASNPHRLSDGRYMFAAMGTTGRDVGWHSAVLFADAEGNGYTDRVVMAEQEGRNFSDTDIVYLPDGRYLAVIREHITRNAYFAHSADEGKTWTAPRPTGLKGANNKLLRLHSGAILYSYRDEDPDRWGVSCSVSENGGETWEFVGQLYVGGEEGINLPGSLCGYPDMAYTADGDIACVLHTYVGDRGEVDLHLLRLKDLT